MRSAALRRRLDRFLAGRLPWSCCCGALLFIALVLRLVYIRRLGDAMNGDEAVGALMALKIAVGEQFPLVFWEAHYSGTLPFLLGAIAFRLSEPSIATLRIAILPLSLVGIAAITSAARALWGGGPALLGGLWLALGPPLLLAYTAEAMNGYPEVLAFGSLAIWLATRLARDPRSTAGGAWTWGMFGVVAGFGVYSLLFVLPVFVGTLWALRREVGGLSRRELAWIAAGFVVGVFPFILYNILHPGASLVRLGARVFDVSRAELGRTSGLLALASDKGAAYLHRLVQYPGALLGNVPVALGLPPWGAWTAAAVTMAAVLVSTRNGRSRLGLDILRGPGLLVLLFIWLSGLDAARHLFPFYLLIPLGLAALWSRATGWLRAAVALGLALAIGHNVVAATTRDLNVGKPAVRALADALNARGIRFVYSDYAISYPLVFLSRERIIASPVAGPVNVDRYPPYTRAIAASTRPTYVFLRGGEAGAVFERELRRTGVPFSREAIHEFDVYTPERHVDPGDLVLLRRF